MDQLMKNKVCLIILLMVMHQSVNAHDPESGFPSNIAGATGTMAASFSSRYESRYFSEGRDSLDGDAIWVNSIEMGYGPITGGLWYGGSPSQDYDELQLSLAISRTFGKVELAIGYTFLEFPFENTSDHEIGFALSIPDLPLNAEFAADVYYSFDAGGDVAELALSRESLTSERLSLCLVGSLGINQGYVTDGHDGANHLAVSMQMDIPIWDQLLLNLHSTYSWAINRNHAYEGDLLLTDFLHWNIGFTWEF